MYQNTMENEWYRNRKNQAYTIFFFTFSWFSLLNALFKMHYLLILHGNSSMFPVRIITGLYHLCIHHSTRSLSEQTGSLWHTIWFKSDLEIKLEYMNNDLQTHIILHIRIYLLLEWSLRYYITYVIICVYCIYTYINIYQINVHATEVISA